jgi:hypothetical protein
VRERVPAYARVLVVSKGDPALVELGNRIGWHFPRGEGGGYAGYYPADSAGAIAQLEAQRTNGADYLLFPSTALWWLEHYVDFKKYLERCYATVVNQEDACLIFNLRQPGEGSMAKQ